MIDVGKERRPQGALEWFRKEYDGQVECPWCGSRETRVISPFGGTVSEMLMACGGCRNTFGWMKWERRRR